VSLSQELLEILKIEAEAKTLSLNATIGRILYRYADFDMKKETLPCITISHILLSKILDKLKESEKNEIVLSAPFIIKKLFVLDNLTFNLQNVIENYFSWVGKYAGWYDFKYEKKDNHYRLIFSSQISKYWIKFVSKYVRYILQSLKIRIDSEHLDDTIVVFEFIED
jgi:hypothetical protein